MMKFCALWLLAVGGVLADGGHHHSHQDNGGSVLLPSPLIPAASVVAAPPPSPPLPAGYSPQDLAYSASEQSEYYSYPADGNSYNDYSQQQQQQQPPDLVGLIADNDRQGLELLITAPIVLTVFAAAMAGALFAPVLSRGFERLAKFRFEVPKFFDWTTKSAAGNETVTEAAVTATEVLDEARALEDRFPWMVVLERTIDVFQDLQKNKYSY